MPSITIDITAAQYAIIKKHVESIVDSRYNEDKQEHEPVKRFATPALWFRWALRQILKGVMDSSTATVVSEKKAQIQALQDEITALADVTVAIKE